MTDESPRATTSYSPSLEELAPADVKTKKKKPPLSWWICIAIGIGAALAGLIPWLVTGMRLPLQNLWANAATPETMPIAWLPFSQYAITLLFALLVMGAAFAGISSRATRPYQRRGGPFWVALGLLAFQLYAAAQTSLTVLDGLQQRSLSSLYLAALVGVVVLSILIGILVLLLIANAPRAGATIGISMAAIAAGVWLGALLRVVVGPVDEGSTWLFSALQWVPAIVVGIGLAWGGLNTVGRILAAPVCLAILWVGPAATTAIANAAGSRGLAHEPREMVEYAITVFFSALTIPELALPPLVLALVVAAVGLVARWLWVRRARGAEPEPEESEESETDGAEPAPEAADTEPASRRSLRRAGPETADPEPAHPAPEASDPEPSHPAPDASQSS